MDRPPPYHLIDRVLLVALIAILFAVAASTLGLGGGLSGWDALVVTAVLDALLGVPPQSRTGLV